MHDAVGRAIILFLYSNRQNVLYFLLSEDMNFEEIQRRSNSPVRTGKKYKSDPKAYDLKVWDGPPLSSCLHEKKPFHVTIALA